MQRIPTIDLHPWQEEAEMKTLQFLVLIDIHHVARSIEKTAHTQVQLVEQSRTPSPVITAGGSAPMLVPDHPAYNDAKNGVQCVHASSYTSASAKESGSSYASLYRCVRYNT